MKKNTLFVFSIFSTLAASSQEVIATQGSSYSNSFGGIDFTVGEVMINTGTDGTYTVTEGFHQSNWNILGVEDNAPDFEATVFPNPIKDVLNIQTKSFDNVSYSLHDLNGKLLKKNGITSQKTSIDVVDLPHGSYFLLLKKDAQILKKINLLKTN